MLGIAFSGGGVRSAAQLGIMQALYENSVRADIYTGTSGGSIVATLLSLGYKPHEAFQLFKEVSGSGIFDIAFWHIFSRAIMLKSPDGLLKGNKLRKSLNQIFDGKKICYLYNRWGIVSTSIENGNQIIFTNAPNVLISNRSKISDDNFQFSDLQTLELADAVTYSCSIPGVFVPREHQGIKLVDGGITNNLPCDVAEALGAKRTISIDLGYSGQAKKISGIQSIVSQSIQVMLERIVDNNTDRFDIYLNPRVYDVGPLEMGKIQECYERGYRFGLLHAGSIKQALEVGDKLAI